MISQSDDFVGAGSKGLNPMLAEDLRARFGDAFTTSKDDCLRHGTDEFRHLPVPPDGVVYSESIQDVSDAVKLCGQYDTPVIPFGTGTSVEGHILAVQGGITLDLSRMNRVLRVNANDFDATIEAGTTRKSLNSYLRDTGLFFPVDPGADASLGGMTATCASGTNAVRYGTMRENVLGLTAVLADGSVVKMGGRARKSSAGYDLTRLFVGSEGTLGIITDVTVRLFGIPERISVAVCPFDSIDGAVNTAIAVIQIGLPVARMEFMDETLMSAVNTYSKMSYPQHPTLFLELHGTGSEVQEHAKIFGELAAENGGKAFNWAESAEDRTILWQARHDAYYAAIALRPGCRGWGTDVCVPISHLAECIEETQADLAALPFPCPIFGHVGDGNYHVLFIINLNAPDEVRLALEANDRMIKRALDVGGTCTGEHGIGVGKREYLLLEHPSGVPIMRQIKGLLDPKGIMNPGKII